MKEESVILRATRYSIPTSIGIYEIIGSNELICISALTSSKNLILGKVGQIGLLKYKFIDALKNSDFKYSGNYLISFIKK